MNTRSTRVAGGLMIAGAVLANIGFIVLGSRFNYPAVLEDPAADILAKFHGDAGTIGALFVVLAAASALIIPIAVLSRGLITRPGIRRFMVVAGVAAGIVQVIGLLRWPLLVPHLADTVANPATSAVARADAIDTFKTLHTYLGGLIGETFGYALTAAWTVAMVVGVSRRPGRWFAPLGFASAALIATGVLEKVGVPGMGLTNFLGYIAWSVWMIAFGVTLLRNRTAAAVASPIAASTPEIALAGSGGNR